jgi:nucleoid-associated protein YgaU
MDRFEALKQKYASVLELIARGGVRLDHLHVQDDKLYMQGAACSEAVKNDVWNQIKAVDSSASDVACDLTIDPSLPAPPPQDTIYIVKAGDSLWKIADKFYGKGHLFKKIIEANPDKLKDENSVIHPGDKLKIPPAN